MSQKRKDINTFEQQQQQKKQQQEKEEQKQQQQQLLNLKIEQANNKMKSDTNNYSQVFYQQCEEVLDAVFAFCQQKEHHIEFFIRWNFNSSYHFTLSNFSTNSTKFELFLDRDRLDQEIIDGLGQLLKQHNLLSSHVKKYYDFVGIPVDLSSTNIRNFVFGSRSSDDIKTRGNDPTFKFVNSTTIPIDLNELEINSDFQGDLTSIFNNYNREYDVRLTIRLEDWSDFTQMNLIGLLKIMGSFSNKHINDYKKMFFLTFSIADSVAINFLDKTELKEDILNELKEITASPINVTHLQFVTLGRVHQSEMQLLIMFLGPLFKSEIFELQCNHCNRQSSSILVTTLIQLKTVLESLWGHQSVLGLSIIPTGYEHVFEDNGVVNVDWDKEQFQQWMVKNYKTLGPLCENNMFPEDFRNQVTSAISRFIESRTIELESLCMIDYHVNKSLNSIQSTTNPSPVEVFFSGMLCDNRNMLGEIKSMMFGNPD